MRIPERILYIAMLSGSASWLIFLSVVYIDANYRATASWVEWAGPLSFILALVVVVAAAIISIWVLVTGPALLRIAVLKWFALLLSSIILLNHIVPLVVPIVCAVALVLLPARRLRNQKAQTHLQNHAA